MYTIKENTVQKAYAKLVTALCGATIVGQTREINNCMVVIERPSIENYHLPYRNVSKSYLESELKWYWSGDNSCETIGKHAKMWLKISDDGKTSNSAYGYILQKKYKFNQIEQIISLLKNDPTSRRAVLNISDPAIDREHTKDMQCTIAIQFLIRHNQLEETVYMRSNDIYFGFPYDYFYFVTIGQYIASKLNLKLGLYTHHATSMHMYLRDEEKFVPYDNQEKININVDTLIKENYNYEK